MIFNVYYFSIGVVHSCATKEYLSYYLQTPTAAHQTPSPAGRSRPLLPKIQRPSTKVDKSTSSTAQHRSFSTRPSTKSQVSANTAQYHDTWETSSLISNSSDPEERSMTKSLVSQELRCSSRQETHHQQASIQQVSSIESDTCKSAQIFNNNDRLKRNADAPKLSMPKISSDRFSTSLECGEFLSVTNFTNYTNATLNNASGNTQSMIFYSQDVDDFDRDISSTKYKKQKENLNQQYESILRKHPSLSGSKNSENHDFDDKNRNAPLYDKEECQSLLSLLQDDVDHTLVMYLEMRSENLVLCGKDEEKFKNMKACEQNNKSTDEPIYAKLHIRGLGAFNPLFATISKNIHTFCYNQSSCLPSVIAAHDSVTMTKASQSPAASNHLTSNAGFSVRSTSGRRAVRLKRCGRSTFQRRINETSNNNYIKRSNRNCLSRTGINMKVNVTCNNCSHKNLCFSTNLKETNQDRKTKTSTFLDELQYLSPFVFRRVVFATRGFVDNQFGTKINSSDISVSVFHVPLTDDRHKRSESSCEVNCSVDYGNCNTQATVSIDAKVFRLRKRFVKSMRSKAWVTELSSIYFRCLSIKTSLRKPRYQNYSKLRYRIQYPENHRTDCEPSALLPGVGDDSMPTNTLSNVRRNKRTYLPSFPTTCGYERIYWRLSTETNTRLQFAFQQYINTLTGCCLSSFGSFPSRRIPQNLGCAMRSVVTYDLKEEPHNTSINKTLNLQPGIQDASCDDKTSYSSSSIRIRKVCLTNSKSRASVYIIPKPQKIIDLKFPFDNNDVNILSSSGILSLSEVTDEKPLLNGKTQLFDVMLPDTCCDEVSSPVWIRVEQLPPSCGRNTEHSYLRSQDSFGASDLHTSLTAGVLCALCLCLFFIRLMQGLFFIVTRWTVL